MIIKNDPAILDWEFRRGDDYGVVMTYRNDLGEPEDLTGYEINGMARENTSSPKLYDIPIVVTDIVNGVFEIDFLGEFTGNLGISGRPQTMKYDIQLKTPEGKTLTFIEGTITVKGDYTRTGD